MDPIRGAEEDSARRSVLRPAFRSSSRAGAGSVLPACSRLYGMALSEQEQKTLSRILRDIEETTQDLSAFEHLTLIRRVRQRLAQTTSDISQLMGQSVEQLRG